MFDVILQNVATRFGISLEKARQLLGMLIAVIFNEKRGGAAGFVDLFRSRGMGDTIASWIGNGPNQAITPAQLDSVLGADMVGAMANRAGVDHATAGSALSAMLPEVFNHLTEDGQIPVGTTIPERLRSYVDGAGDFIRDLGAGVVGMGAAAVGAVGAAANRATHAVGAAAERPVAERPVNPAPDRVVVENRVPVEKKSGMGLLPWILLAGLLALALFALTRCNKKEAAPVPAPAAPATPVAAQANHPVDNAVKAQPTFNFDSDGVKATVNGALGTDAEKARLMDALKKTFGEGNVNGDITVNPNTAPAGWLDKLIAMLPELKAKGLKFGFDGNTLKLDTAGMSEDDRFRLSDAFRTSYRDGDYQITGLWDRAMAALSGLKEGFTSDDLVKGLNLMNVYFATDSAKITNDSFETLKAAADAIKRSPAGTKIEAGGHTDNTGDAAHNMQLSQQRAEAVVAKLKELGVADGILTAKGYGQDKPIADNATDAGKAKNRRMEFTVLK